jgi:hypothetical protein
MTLNNYSAIHDIFYSGNVTFAGEKQVISDILFLLKEKYLTIEKCPIASKEKYFECVSEVESASADAILADGGGTAHVALKLLSGLYLKKSENLEVVYEQKFCGYVPDVLSADKKIVIECGHTQNPEKIFAYFRHGNVQECIQIPYPNENEKIIFGYKLRPSALFNEFYDFWESKRHSGVKSLIVNRANTNT